MLFCHWKKYEWQLQSVSKEFYKKITTESAIIWWHWKTTKIQCGWWLAGITGSSKAGIPSCQSPCRKQAAKSTATFTCTALYHSKTSLKYLTRRCNGWMKQLAIPREQLTAKLGEKVILMDLIEENRTSLGMLLWRNRCYIVKTGGPTMGCLFHDHFSWTMQLSPGNT